MERWFSMLVLLLAFVLGGCSTINDSLAYVNSATGYVTKVSEFVNEAPSIAKQAVNNEQARETLETKLQGLREEIQAFNKLSPPEMASRVHEEIVKQNDKLQKEIDTYSQKLKEGTVQVEAFQSSELFQTLKEVSGLLNKIQALTN
jgi:hypothetical protein